MTLASPLKSTSTSYLSRETRQQKSYAARGAIEARGHGARTYSSGMPRIDTSVKPATKTAVAACVMQRLRSQRGKRTTRFQVSDVVWAASDVGVQDIPLLPKPVLQYEEKMGTCYKKGSSKTDEGLKRQTMPARVQPLRTAAAWARPHTAPARQAEQKQPANMHSGDNSPPLAS
jgi:hypothetical protein